MGNQGVISEQNLGKYETKFEGQILLTGKCKKRWIGNEVSATRYIPKKEVQEARLAEWNETHLV